MGKAVSESGESKLNTYAKDKSGDEQPPIALVQLAGRLTVMSSDDLSQHRLLGVWRSCWEFKML